MSLVPYTLTHMGSSWRAYPVRNRRGLIPSLRDGAIGIPPGFDPNNPPTIQPDWDLIFQQLDQPTGKPYRPSQWSRPSPDTEPSQMYMVKLQAKPQVVTPVAQTGATGFTIKDTTATKPATYFFDAVLRADHVQHVEVTHHPIQSGAAVSDHAYIEPARLSLNVGFSDVVDRYQPTDYPGPSKSLAAYDTFLGLLQQLQPLTVFTRLRQYNNMVLTNIEVTDDNHQIQGLRMTLVFEEVIFAQVSTTELSVTAPVESQREQTSGTSNEGHVGVTIPDPGSEGYSTQAEIDQAKADFAAGGITIETGKALQVIQAAKAIDGGKYSSTVVQQ